jgi:hypothetical protein
MSTDIVIGYERATAEPVELAARDIEEGVLIESSEDNLARILTGLRSGLSTLVLDFSGGLSGAPHGMWSADPGEAFRYAFSCEGDEGRFSDLLARGLVAALNLNEEEHVALAGAARTYYANAEAGGIISISSMLPERSKQLELLKAKLDELTVIPPSFGNEALKPAGMVLNLKALTTRYARRALAYSAVAKYVQGHQRATVIVESLEEMLPESQTRSMRYPLEVAVEFLREMKDMGATFIVHCRGPVLKEVESIFETTIIEDDGFHRIKLRGRGWREAYLVNDLSGREESEPTKQEAGETKDEEALRAVIQVVHTYSNVTYAGLVSFLKGKLDEGRAQAAADSLLRGGYVELRAGLGRTQVFSLTDAGKTLLSTLGGEEE